MQVDTFVRKLKDPGFKNNSSNVSGLFGGGAVAVPGQSSLMKYDRSCKSNYKYLLSKDIADSDGKTPKIDPATMKDIRLNQILDQSEHLNRMIYFTPEKTSASKKVKYNS